LLCYGFCAAVVLHQPFADHVRAFDAGQDDARAAEILEPHHRSDDAFDGAVVLLEGVVQVFFLADLDRRRSPGIERFEGGQIGAALVDCDRFGYAALINPTR
jgi:hypothetical protein